MAECRIYTSPPPSFQPCLTLPQLSPFSLPSFPYYPTSTSGVSNGSIVGGKSDLLDPLLLVGGDDPILPVECGLNRGLLVLSKLCQGSKGSCILHQGTWLTPNEFQMVSGRVTAKDWKRSIRHNGKSLKLLISKGAFLVHSPLCSCGNGGESGENRRRGMMELCSSPNNRNRSNGGGGGVKGESRLTSIIHNLLATKTNEGCSPSSSSSESEFGIESLPSSSSNSAGRTPMNQPFSQTIKESRRKGIIHHKNRDSPSGESGEDDGGSRGGGSTLPNTPTPHQPPTSKSRTSKKQRGGQPIKSERQSPQSERSSPSPSKPQSNGGPPSPPLRQMEQMMSRNYSDYMRSLAAKYNHGNPNDIYSPPRSSQFNFDSRFLKPGAAAAAASLLAFQQEHGDKLQFPLIDMSSTQTLLSMVRSAAASVVPGSSGPSGGGSLKRPTSPLDLSSAAALVGHLTTSSSLSSPPKKSKGGCGKSGKGCGSSCSGCSGEGEGITGGWTVEDVCRFVSSIDICAEYVQAFRDHSIDGSSLPLLTEEHLMTNMNMKLGPALKFKTKVAKKLGNCPICAHCTHCHVPPDIK